MSREIVLSTNEINHKRQFILAWVLLIAIFTVILSVLFIQFYPFNPVDFHSVAVEGNNIKAGNPISYILTMDKHTVRVPRISRFLESKEDPTMEISLGSLLNGSSKISDKKKVVFLELPKYIKPGEYRIKAIAVYDYFGVREVEKRYYSSYFTISR
jgi:hypothetical protein